MPSKPRLRDYLKSAAVAISSGITPVIVIEEDSNPQLCSTDFVDIPIVAIQPQEVKPQEICLQPNEFILEPQEIYLQSNDEVYRQPLRPQHVVLQQPLSPDEFSQPQLVVPPLPNPETISVPAVPTSRHEQVIPSSPDDQMQKEAHRVKDDQTENSRQFYVIEGPEGEGPEGDSKVPEGAPVAKLAAQDNVADEVVEGDFVTDNAKPEVQEGREVKGGERAEVEPPVESDHDNADKKEDDDNGGDFEMEGPQEDATRTPMKDAIPIRSGTHTINDFYQSMMSPEDFAEPSLKCSSFEDVELDEMTAKDSKLTDETAEVLIDEVESANIPLATNLDDVSINKVSDPFCED